MSPTEEGSSICILRVSNGYFAACIRELRIVRTGLADDSGIIDNLSPSGVLYITASTNSNLDNPLDTPTSDV